MFIDGLYSSTNCSFACDLPTFLDLCLFSGGLQELHNTASLSLSLSCTGSLPFASLTYILVMACESEGHVTSRGVSRVVSRDRYQNYNADCNSFHPRYYLPHIMITVHDPTAAKSACFNRTCGRV